MDQQLKLLGHGSSVFRRQAVVGVFALLGGGGGSGGAGSVRSGSGSGSGEARDAVLQCLTSRHADVVDEAVAQLLAAVKGGGGGRASGGLDAHAALELLLAALERASPRAAPAIARGAVAAFLAQTEGAAPAAAAATWSRHPLSAALLAHPTGCGAAAVVAAAGAELDPQQLALAWPRLAPFYSFVLLHTPGDGGSGSSGDTALDAAALQALQASLVAGLVRAACGSRAVAARAVPFLARHLVLAASPWGGGSGSDGGGGSGGTIAHHHRPRLRAAAFVADAVDALDAHSPAADPLSDSSGNGGRTDHAWWWASVGSVAAACVCLAGHAAPTAGGGSGGLNGALPQLLAAMHRLGDIADEAGPAPGRGRARVWAPWLPELAALSVGAGEAERCSLLALMAGALACLDGDAKAQPGPTLCATPEAALLLVPLLHTLVLAPGADSKRWAAALLAAVRRQQQPWLAATEEDAETRALAAHPPALAAVAAARRLLSTLWPLTGDEKAAAAAATERAVAWAGALGAAIRCARDAAAAGAAAGASETSALLVPLPSARAVRRLEGEGDGDGIDTGNDGGAAAAAVELTPGAAAALGALLAHPDARAAAAAARTLRELVLAAPASAPPFLPLLLLRLRHLSEERAHAAASAKYIARAQTALLDCLPAMTADATTAAFAMRALQPLAVVEAPPVLRAVALRLVVDGWLVTNRGWARAEAAINGYAPPSTTALAAAAAGGLGPRARDLPPQELRLARAAALRRACAAGSARALELAWSLQDALADPRAPVAAMALDAVGDLVAAGGLDFYGAWAVVARAMPRPPESPLLASRWVALLAGGAAGAEASPEAAAAVVDLVWAATEHTAPRVRAAAYAALAAFGPALLERLELEEPAAAYTDPLAKEAAAVDEAAAAGNSSALRDARRALAAAEKLALAAVLHEHSQRRRFLAGAAGAGGAGGGAGSAAAAAGREEAALRRRLLHAARDIALSGGGDGGGGGGAASQLSRKGGGATGGVMSAGASVGAMLLLWHPAASSSGAAGAATAAASAAYARLLSDAAARVPARPSPWTDPGLAAPAWRAFAGRWLAASPSGAEGLLQALRARWREGGAGDAAAACWAAAGLASAGALSEAQTADVLAELRRLLRLAAGRRGSSTGGSRQRSDDSIGSDGNNGDDGDGEGETDGQGVVAVSVAAAACAAAARVLPTLHPVDWRSRGAVVHALRDVLMAQRGGGADSGGMDDNDAGVSGDAGGGARSAAAEALAFAACHALRLSAAHGGGGGSSGSGEMDLGSLGGGSDNGDPGVSLAVAAFAPLVAVLGRLQPSEAAALRSLTDALPSPAARAMRAAAAPSIAPDLSLAAAAREDPWLLASLRRAVGAVCAAFAETHASPALGQAAANDAARLAAAAAAAAADSPGGPAQHAEALAAVAALPDAALAALEEASLPDGAARARAAASTLQALALSPTVHGWLGGAAALGWARLVGALLRLGLPLTDADGSSSAVDAASSVVEALAALCAGRAPPNGGGAAHRGAAAWALRCGAAAGLAELLGADVAGGAFGAGLGADGLPAGGQPLCWLLAPTGPADAAARVKVARTALRALEAAALGGGGSGGSGSGGSGIGSGRVSAGAAALAPSAAWFLAATSAAAAAGSMGGVGAAGQSGGGAAAAGAPPPLAAYPRDGALRPLAERVLAAGAGEGAAASGSALATAAAASSDSPPPPAGPTLAAAILRVMAAAPRLPAAGWEGVCRRALLRKPSASAVVAVPGSQAPPADEELRAAALAAALAHAQVPAHGLAPLLDQVLMPAAFAGLPAPCRAMLLRALPDLVACLPANRAAPLLQSLPGLVPPLESAQHAADLHAAAWLGMGRLCGRLAVRDAAVAGKGVVPPLLGAAAALIARLPPLPALAPGHILALASGAIASGNDDDEGDGADDAGAEEHNADGGQALPPPPGLSADGWLAWVAAVRGLRCFKQEQVASLTAVAPPPETAGDAPPPSAAAGGAAPPHAGDSLGGVARCQLRALLVLAGMLSWRELTPCRGAVIRGRAGIIAGGGGGGGASMVAAAPASALAALVLPLAMACRCAPQAAQVQAVQEALRAAPLCAAGPGNAVAFAAALVAACALLPTPLPALIDGAPIASAALSAVDAAIAAGGGGGGDSSSSPGAAALNGLPFSLPGLAARPAWAPSIDGIVAGFLNATADSKAAAADAGAVRAAVLAAALSVRPHLGGATWAAVVAAGTTNE